MCILSLSTAAGTCVFLTPKRAEKTIKNKNGYHAYLWHSIRKDARMGQSSTEFHATPLEMSKDHHNKRITQKSSQSQ